jgi:hypothetical protein
MRSETDETFFTHEHRRFQRLGMTRRLGLRDVEIERLQLIFRVESERA